MALVELTCGGIRPDPNGLRVISRDSGVAIVMGCGCYLESFAGQVLTTRGVDALMADMIAAVEGHKFDNLRRVLTVGHLSPISWWSYLKVANFADIEATEQARSIESAIDFAYDQATQDWRGFPEGSPESIEEGIDAWECLKRDTGFDLQDVFRRRALIPFVLVPRQVAAKHGSSDKLSMFRNLQQAHDAFVYGANYL